MLKNDNAVQFAMTVISTKVPRSHQRYSTRYTVPDIQYLPAVCSYVVAHTAMSRCVSLSTFINHRRLCTGQVLFCDRCPVG